MEWDIPGDVQELFLEGFQRRFCVIGHYDALRRQSYREWPKKTFRSRLGIGIPTAAASSIDHDSRSNNFIEDN